MGSKADCFRDCECHIVIERERYDQNVGIVLWQSCGAVIGTLVALSRRRYWGAGGSWELRMQGERVRVCLSLQMYLETTTDTVVSTR